MVENYRTILRMDVQEVALLAIGQPKGQLLAEGQNPIAESLALCTDRRYVLICYKVSSGQLTTRYLAGVTNDGHILHRFVFHSAQESALPLFPCQEFPLMHRAHHRSGPRVRPPCARARLTSAGVG